MEFIMCFVSDTLNSPKEFLANSKVIGKYRICLSQIDRMNMIFKLDSIYCNASLLSCLLIF
jgi:hypothetical protein